MKTNMNKIVARTCLGLACFAGSFGTVLAQSQSVDLAADSRYNETLDAYNGSYPGLNYTAYIQSGLAVGSLASPLPASRISWRITSQGYFDIPNDLPNSFVSEGVTWNKIYYFYDITDGPSSTVWYENATPVPNNYIGTFEFQARTIRTTPGFTQALIGWNTQVVPINGAFDNNAANNSYNAPITVSSAPLPVKLASFTAKKEGQTSLLNWTTTEEANSERFSIEHSLNGKTWSEIGSIASKGESTTLQRYDFTHQDPSNGDNYYRLKMVDKDRAFAYSSIQVVKFEGIQDIAMVYPNPASDVVKVNTKDFAQVKSVRMYDLNGRPVYTAAGRAVAQQIDVKSMTPGNYIVEITKISGEVKSTKIVIIR